MQCPIVFPLFYIKNLTNAAEYVISRQSDIHTGDLQKFCYILIIKPTRCTNSKIYFWNKTLHISDGISVHHQQFFTVHTAMVYVIHVC